PHYENVPFEVPEGWVWTTVSDISKSILYGVSESAKSEGKYKLLRITDIQDNKVDWETVPFTDFDDNKVSSYILHNGDIVFARTGATVGKSYLIQGLSQKAIYASYLIRIQTFDLILPEYVKLFFESGYYWEQIELSSVGIGQPNVNGTILGYLNIPLPPFAEQKRIVIEIEQWLSLIDQIEQGKDDLHSVIKQTKSKILDLAIHGKLVPQDPNDEPAIELLKRINPDFTPCDNGHSRKFPQSWCSVTVNDVCSIIGGVSYNKADIQDTGIRVLRGGNIQNGKVIDCFDDVFIPLSYQNNDNQVQHGDIIVVASTGSQTLIGKTGFADRDIPKTQIGAFLRIVRPKQKALSPYIRLIFQTDDYKGYIRNVAKGSNINNVKNAHLQNYQIYLPPLEEQQRIVQKIEELFSVLDNIQKALEV
ncbi:restriction endonuclease subunit S, partial [Bacteroides acidifaciens]|uniref:restriction endonuclease subunit S n=1 Tax=Bacteroides acidifaciens TaxID=85831 RepID=UPI0025B445C6